VTLNWPGHKVGRVIRWGMVWRKCSGGIVQEETSVVKCPENVWDNFSSDKNVWCNVRVSLVSGNV